MFLLNSSLLTLAIITLTIPEIQRGEHEWAFARLVGTVTDVLDDETDPNHVFFTVQQGEDSILVPVGNAKKSYPELRKLIGATVEFRGMCENFIQVEKRRHQGYHLDVEFPTNLTVVAPAPDIFDAPDVLKLDGTRPEAIARMSRHRATGRVLAVWGRDNVLLQMPSNQLVRFQLADPAPPHSGDSVEVVGFPETDLYHINLSRAQWRPAQPMELPPETVRATAISALFTDAKTGTPIFEERLYGKTLRLSGRIQSMPRGGILLLEDRGFVVPVDVTALGNRLPSDMAENGRLEVTGACIIDVDNWRPHAPFPKIRGITVVARTPDDLRVLARPPWWTPARLLAVIGGLFAVILLLFVRNRLQKRFGALKLAERTRMAVELHDALSQCLTGVSMEIETAEQYADGANPDLVKHLTFAGRALDSSRNELKNCLWDLRNQAIDDPDLTSAVRRTLLPHCKDIELSVRFNVPRNRLSDNTAYAILKIVRELAVNGMRHGKATAVKVAGSIEGDELLFSVRDNGRGFNPDDCPGVREGHFGLQGVRERIQQLDGSLAIESAPGRGTRSVVRIPIRSHEDTGL